MAHKLIIIYLFQSHRLVIGGNATFVDNNHPEVGQAIRQGTIHILRIITFKGGEAALCFVKGFYVDITEKFHQCIGKKWYPIKVGTLLDWILGVWTIFA